MRKTCDGCKHMPKVYMPGQGICSSCVNYNLWEEKKESKGEYSMRIEYTKEETMEMIKQAVGRTFYDKDIVSVSLNYNDQLIIELEERKVESPALIEELPDTDTMDKVIKEMNDE